MRLIRTFTFGLLIVAGLAGVALAGLADGLNAETLAERVRVGIARTFDRPVFATRHSVVFADHLSVVLHDVTMARQVGRPSPALIAADAIEVRLEPWPLLFGILVVERVEIIAPRMIAQGELQALATWRLPIGASGAPDIIVRHGSGRLDIGLDGTRSALFIDAVSGRWRPGHAFDLTATGRLGTDIPFVFDGTLSTGTDGISFAARSLTVGATDFIGAWTVEPRCDRPRVTANLATENLNLDAWIARLPLGDMPDLVAIFGPAPEPFGRGILDTLAALDIVLDLDAVRAELGGHSVHDANFVMSLANGRLAVTELRARTGEGSFSFAAVVDRNQASHSVSLRAQDLALSSFSANGNTARASVDVSLTGEGRDWPTLFASLSGNARIDLVDVETQVPRADLFDVVFPWVRETGRFTVDRLIAELAIDAGRIVTEEFRVDTPRVALDIDGVIDFHERTLHVELLPAAKDSEIAALSVPLMISGPLADPAVLPNPAHPATSQ